MEPSIEKIRFNLINVNRQAHTYYQITGWELSKRFTDEDLVVDLEELGFTSVSGSIDTIITEKNFDDMRTLWSDITSEIFCRSSLSLRGRMQQMLKFGQHILQGRTPDLVFQGTQVEFPDEIIEFKSSFVEYCEDYQQEMVESINEKYGSLGAKKGTLIYMVLDYTLSEKLKMGKELTIFYNHFYNQFMTVLQTTKSRKRCRSDLGLMIPDLFRKLSSNLPVQDRVNPEIKYTNVFTKDHINEWIAVLEKGEQFMDYHYMDQAEAAAVSLKELEARLANIYGPKYWDRDECKKKTGERRKFTPSFGHRAAWLMYWPIFKYVIGLNPSSPNNSSMMDLIPLLLKATKVPGAMDPRIQPIVYNLITAYAVTESEREELRVLKKKQAYLETEAVKADIVGTPGVRSSVEEVVGLSNAQIKLALDKIAATDIGMTPQGRPKVSVTSSGYYRYRLTADEEYFLGINRQYNKSAKDELDHIDFTEVQFDLEEIFNSFPRGPGWSVELKDFYKGNKSLNEVTNNILLSSQYSLNYLFKSREAGYFFTKQKFLRAYQMAFPTLVRKKLRNNDMTLFEVEGISAVFLATAPVGITSGVIVAIAELSEFKEFPEGWLPYHVSDIDGRYIAVSQPFRVKMDEINQYDEFVAGYLATALLNKSYGVNIVGNALFHSMFWEYTRQLNMVTSVIYLLLKNSINYGTLGRQEYVKKFEGLIVRDVRVALILRNIRQNYRSFAKKMQRRMKTGSKDFLDLRDPVFGFRHNSLQSLLSIVYLKQIYWKQDGFDESAVMANHYINEGKFVDIWENSPFNSVKFSPTQDIKLSEFAAMVWPEPGKQTEISYHPGVCYWAPFKMATEAARKAPHLRTANHFGNQSAIDTKKQSRCLFFDSKLPDAMRQKSKERQEHEKQLGDAGKIPGLQSIQLSEALFIEVTNMKDDMVANPQKYGLTSAEVESILAHDPSLGEVVFYECTSSPKTAVLTVSVKRQSEKEKRIFFVQTIDGRNLRKFTDEAFNDLLKACSEDMIMDAGDKKFLTLEHKMNALGIGGGYGIIITEDQTKYGDLYPIESFYPMLCALTKFGYFTQDQADIVQYSLEGIKKRIILAPPCVKKLLDGEGKKMKMWLDGEMKEVDKYEFRYPRGTMQGDRFWKMLETLKRISTTPKLWEGYIGVPEEFAKIEQWSLGIRKDVGFILGVFNKLGSTLSACQLYINEFIFELFGLKGLVDGATHSDDSLKLISVKSPQSVKLHQTDLSYYWSRLRAGWRFSKNPDAEGGVKIVDLNGISHDVGGDVIAKFAAVVSLVAPRLIGQRPSLTKWGIGPSGEVLQMMCISGKMIPPIMRFAKAIGADVPGKSPASDLYSAVGRAYQLVSNGMNIQGVSDLMLLANWFCYDRFGYKQKHMTNVERKLPELGGFIWFYPPLLLDTGFYSNHIRLLMNSMYDPSIASQFSLLVDTDEVFKQNHYVTQSDYEDADVVVESEEIQGSVVAIKDFLIRFRRNLKTLFSFKVLTERWRYMFDAYLERLSGEPFTKDALQEIESLKRVRKHSDYIRLFKNVISDKIMGHLGDFQDKAISFLNRYTQRSFQESYLRIPLGVLTTNRLGYRRRLFPNPFSTKFKVQFKDIVFTKNAIPGGKPIKDHNGDIVTVETPEMEIRWIHSILLTLADRHVKLQQNTKLYETLLLTRRKMINDTQTMVVNLMASGNVKQDKEYHLRWRSLDLKREAGSYSVDSALLVAALIQSRKYNLTFDRLPVVVSKPFLFNDSVIMERYKHLVNLVDRMGYSINDVIRNSRVFSTLLDDSGFLGIFRGYINTEGTDRDYIRDYILYNTNYDQIFEGNVVYNTSRIEVTNEVNMNQNVAFRALSLIYSVASVDEIPLSSFSIETKSRRLTHHSLMRVIAPDYGAMRSSNNVDYNRFLLYQMLSDTRVLLERQGINTPNLLTFFKNPKEPREVGLRLLTSHQSKEPLYYSVSPVGQGDNKQTLYNMFSNDHDPFRLNFMIKFMSYFLHPREHRITELKKRVTKEGDYLFGPGDVLQRTTSRKSVSIYEKGRREMERKVLWMHQSEMRQYYYQIDMTTYEDNYFWTPTGLPRQVNPEDEDLREDKVVVHYRDPYNIQLWDTYRTPTGLTIKWNIWDVNGRDIECVYTDAESPYENRRYSISKVTLDENFSVSALHPTVQLMLAIINACKRHEAEASYLTASEELSLEAVGHIVQLCHHTGIHPTAFSDVESYNPNRVNSQRPNANTKANLENTGLHPEFIYWSEVELFSKVITRQPRNMGSWVYQAMLACNTVFRGDTFDWIRPRVSSEIEDLDSLFESASIRRVGMRPVWKTQTGLDIPNGLSVEIAYLYLGMTEPHSKDLLRRLVSLPRPGVIGHGIISYYLAYCIMAGLWEECPKLVNLIGTYTPSV